MRKLEIKKKSIVVKPAKSSEAAKDIVENLNKITKQKKKKIGFF